MTVKQVATLTGVSVRTLHWYDKIGLFKPHEVSDSGYRMYDDSDLESLQQILFFRELGFELKEIKNIINSSDFDNNETLLKHKELLTLKAKRINKLIKLVDQTMKGEQKMSFKEFDMTEIENAQKEYKQEVEERWGETDAYKESKRKTSTYSKEDWVKIKSESENIYNSFVKNMGLVWQNL